MKQIIPGLWEIDEIGSAVHCYLWEWDGGATLIDTGMPGTADALIQALLANGIPLHGIRRIIITHMDPDHAGGLAALAEATQATVICHAVEKQLLERPSLRRPGRFYLVPLFRLFSLLPAARVTPVTPDELVVDGDETVEGFTVIHTPGHTPGHIALLHRGKRVLIAGDALTNRRNQLRSSPRSVNTDHRNALRSIWKIAKKYGDDFEVVVFGHGPPIMDNGAKRVKALVSRLFSGEV